jgi:uncharacterized protein (DUF433 family)
MCARIIEELGINSPDEAAAWAHLRLPAKNKLTAADAKIMEEEFRARLATVSDAHVAKESCDGAAPGKSAEPQVPFRLANMLVIVYIRRTRKCPMKFTRITVDPKQMGGVPCIRGLRIPVATVIGMIADGMVEEEIVAAYPDLEREDIHEALRYAADAVRERELPLAIP